VQSRYSGHGAHTCKTNERAERSLKKRSLQKKYKKHGVDLLTFASTPTTKISSTSSKSKFKSDLSISNRGSPHELLKSINPAEASLLDAASKLHVRFRLGGSKFPPLIYYKIFSHGGVVDINAFAPRDYMQMKKDTGKQAINVHYDKPENDNHNGWYLRFENNGWRPINDKVLAQVD